MELSQAVELLTQGLNGASKAGVYNLNDAALLNKALDVVKTFADNNTPEKGSIKPVEKSK